MSLPSRAPRLSAGVVVVDPQAEPRYLLLRAFRNWDFPKGQVEPGERAFDAARREAREETGIDDLRFPWGEAYRETEPYARGKTARYYLGCTRERPLALPVSPELGRPEHHEYRWAGYEEAQRLLPVRLRPILDWARERLASSELRR